ncbi:MAG: monoheme cytochrome C [Flavobacteriales bacterium]|nr:monoheme cytochrome C [Flavobacteriales bacterium]
MDENQLDPKEKKDVVINLIRTFNLLHLMFWVIVTLLLLVWIDPDFLKDEYWEPNTSEMSINQDFDELMRDSVVNGIHVISGLKAEGDYQLIVSYCGRCHSYELVTQNRATKSGWKEMIIWMQETQELQDLGEHETPILEYLATFYAPEDKGRRPQLNQAEINWYELE